MSKVTAEQPYRFGNGWWVRRIGDGAVLFQGPQKAARIIILPDEWPSIVAHVADGGTAATFSTVQRLHFPGVVVRS